MVSYLFFLAKPGSEENVDFLKDPPEEMGGAYSWVFVGDRIGIAMGSSGSNASEPSDQDASIRNCFFVDDESGCMVVSDSRIDYRQELAGKLGINRNEGEGYSDSNLILLAYLRWGEACLSYLYGDFSFVIWNPSKDQLFCARDHFGCRPLYYVDQPGYLVVASQLTAFECVPGFRFKIREQYILDVICSIVRIDTLSAYTGINRLLPAHYLTQNHGQVSDQYRYWDLRIDENVSGITLEEAAEGLRDRMIEAIRQRSQASGHKGVELSGGLDSSGIASILTILSGPDETIHAFTHSISSGGTASPMSQKSEMEFSKALVESYGSIRQFQITGEDSEGGYHALIKALARLNKPINQHYAMNSDLLFEVAANAGTSIIFSGLGGDEGITNNGSGYFSELIRRGQHSKLRDTIKGHAFSRGRPVYRVLIRLYLEYYAPWVINLYKKDWRKDTYHSSALQKGLARKYRMKLRFLKSHSLPGKADVRGIQYFRIMHPNIPERIEETAMLAKQYGIEYRFPLLDVKLLEFFYSLPSEYKFKDGMGRYLFRRAMKDILPEKIRMRTDKGGNTIPYVFTRTLHNEQIYREIIDEGRLKNHFHYVDYDKLHAMLDSYKKPGDAKQQDYGLRPFQSAMSVLVLQKWQREGKIDIGIKC